MMRVPTYVATSTIPGAGLGVFTAEAVPAGTVIWRFDPGLDLLLDGLPEDKVARSFVEKYGYEPLDQPGQWLVCVDNGRFVNHSDTPNTSDTFEETVALVDLPAGTEITSDYRAFCRQPFLGWDEAPSPMFEAA